MKKKKKKITHQIENLRLPEFLMSVLLLTQSLFSRPVASKFYGSVHNTTSTPPKEIKTVSRLTKQVFVVW